MADLTPLQLRWLRGEVGSPPAAPSDVDLQAIYDDVGTVRDVAIRVIRQRVDALLATPLSVSIAGVASVNNTANVAALEKRLGQLARLDDDPSDEPGETVDAELATGRWERYSLTRSRGR